MLIATDDSNVIVALKDIFNHTKAVWNELSPEQQEIKQKNAQTSPTTFLSR
jgi:hypothetical protein